MLTIDYDTKKSIRGAFGEELADLGAKNSRVVALDADLSGSTQTSLFAKAFPERFFDVGIAEHTTKYATESVTYTGTKAAPETTTVSATIDIVSGIKYATIIATTTIIVEHFVMFIPAVTINSYHNHYLLLTYICYIYKV